LGADPYDIVAVILGVMFTLRKLDVRARHAEQHPGVAPDDFERWQRMAHAAYSIGSYACLFRILFHFGFARYATQHALAPLFAARVGVVADGIWVAALVTGFVKARSARLLRQRLGIVLDRPSPG
jgi:hypothetical protein